MEYFKSPNFWISAVVGLALAVMAAYIGTIPKGEAIPLWAVLVNAGAGYLALLIKGGGVEIKKPPTGGVAGLLVLLAAIGLMVSAGCKGPNHGVWATLDTLQGARKLAGQQLASSAKAKHDKCLTAHGSKTPEYSSCIKGHREALRQWQKNIRPAVDSAIQVAATATQIADKAKRKVGDWISLIKPAACALARVAKSWAHYFPDKAKSILTALQFGQEVTCE